MPVLNRNNSAVKRIMREARELVNDPSTDYSAAPLEDDIFEWHCTLRGSPGTEFEGGLYHFRILLPAEYPFRPPSIMMLTPNGRFELNTKVCVSHHEELWQPAWGVRTAIIGLQGFFPLKGQAAVGVGSIEYPAAERKRLALLSREWVCPHCQQTNVELLPDPAELAPTGHRLGTRAEMEAEEAAKADEADEAEKVQKAEEQAAERPEEKTEERRETEPRVAAAETRTGKAGPPVLLDGAICIVFVLLFALLCRRFV
ncbi:Ubiquitin-conjugating enzyme E2 32 [Leucoagaricus sp. SymC.cos]|nr:Ubiquitin-conjugating enzyme E2 32 [Leucoagaricus sp. SymC.cos]